MRWGAALAVLVVALAVSLGLYLADVPGQDTIGATSEPTNETVRETAVRTPVVAPPTLAGRPVPDALLAESEAGIFGRVVHARNGAPVPRVPLLVRGDLPSSDGEDDEPQRGTITSFTSDEKGEFRVRLEPGTVVQVLAVGGGWINAEAAEQGFTWSDTQRWRSERRKGRWVAHDVQVLPAAHVEGRVLLADGGPAVGALVRPIEQEVEPTTNPSAFPWTAIPEVSCDENGRFCLDGLPLADTLLLGAHHPYHGEAHAGPLDVEPGETTTVEMRFPANREVTIGVVDGVGSSPLEGANVVASWPQVGSKPRSPSRRRERPTVVRSGTSDARGLVRLRGLPDSPIQVVVTAPDYLPVESGGNAWEDVLKDWSSRGEPVRVTLFPGAWIAGRMECPDHVRGPWLAVECEAVNAPGFADFKATTSIETDGTFRVLAPRTGRFRLSVYLHTYDWTVDGSMEVSAGDTEVVFRPEIHGQQREPPDTRPHWDVRVRGPEGQRVRCVGVGDAGDGGALLAARGTEDEDCRVQVFVHRGGSGVWLSLYDGITLEGERLGGTVAGPFDTWGGEAEVRLPEAWSVSGRVVDSSGMPVQGANVEARAEPPPKWLDVKDINDWPTWDSRHGDGYTDADGRFDIQGLGDQTYLLSVRAMGALRPPTPARIQAGTPEVTLRMIAGVTRRLTILGADGEPIAGATVHVGQTNGAQGPSDGTTVRGFTTDAEGVAVINHLEPGGTYTMSIHDAFPYTRRGSGRTIQSEWKPKDDVIRLHPRHEVRGIVVDAEGNPVGGAYVYMKDARDRVERDRTASDGTFAFGSLVPGVVRLAAVYGRGDFGWNPPAEFPVEAGAGEEDVVVRLVSRRDLAVTCDASRAPDKMPSWWYLVALDGSEEPERYCAHATSRSTSALFRDLEPGMRYRLWAGPSEDGWYLLADIDPTATTATVVLRRGATVRGRLLLPPGTIGAGVRVTDPGVYLRATARVEDGSWELRGVPEGTWSLRGSCYVDGDSRSAVVRISPGDAPEIDLTGEARR